MLSKLANLPIMKQTANKFAAKYPLPYIERESDQCRCVQCFACYDKSGHMYAMPNPATVMRKRLHCALDDHRIVNERMESCPMGKPGL